MSTPGSSPALSFQDIQEGKTFVVGLAILTSASPVADAKSFTVAMGASDNQLLKCFITILPSDS